MRDSIGPSLLATLAVIVIAGAPPALAQDAIGDWLRQSLGQSPGEPAESGQTPREATSILPPAVAEELRRYRRAAAEQESRVAAFWSEVNDKRSDRRRKRSAGAPVTAADYVAGFPPPVQLPALGKEAAAALAEEQRRDPPKPTPTVEDFLAQARAIYQFTPERISEAEFKRRYAAEALEHGLSPEQVLRVYALETGGIGTADMQAGINPITRHGRAISTALGYAQLLHANSVSELVKHGEAFIQRLGRMAAARDVEPARAAALAAKGRAVRQMLARARTVPNEWSAHTRFASTPEGLGIHALNLDGDIGPWLQVVKLDGVQAYGAEQGRPNLSGAELELMNLAGPATGIEMMTAVGAVQSTPNYFSRMGYERNSIVRGRSARELLLELDRRMDGHLTKAGAVEFAEIFAAVARDRAGRARGVALTRP